MLTCGVLRSPHQKPEREHASARAASVGAGVNVQLHMINIQVYFVAAFNGKATVPRVAGTCSTLTVRIACADAAFFALLDRDSDGKVTIDDLKECLRKHNLPGDYAHQFIERARGGRWWQNSITYKEFKSLVDDNESKMLRAFSLLETDAKGNLNLDKLKGMPQVGLLGGGTFASVIFSNAVTLAFCFLHGS